MVTVGQCMDVAGVSVHSVSSGLADDGDNIQTRHLILRVVAQLGFPCPSCGLLWGATSPQQVSDCASVSGLCSQHCLRVPQGRHHPSSSGSQAFRTDSKLGRPPRSCAPASRGHTCLWSEQGTKQQVPHGIKTLCWRSVGQSIPKEFQTPHRTECVHAHVGMGGGHCERLVILPTWAREEGL